MIRYHPDDDAIEIACDRRFCPSTEEISRGPWTIKTILFSLERAKRWRFARDRGGDFTGALCADCVRADARAAGDKSFQQWWARAVAPKLNAAKKKRAREAGRRSKSIGKEAIR